MIPSTTAVSEEEPGVLLDVVIIDLDCLATNNTCSGYRPAHLVEYMGADWCQPCRIVESQLDERAEDDTFILRHHPSPRDVSFLSESYYRFSTILGLWGLPSMVIDGEGLLAGSSQIGELEFALSNRSGTNFTGLTSVELVNGTLHWNTTTTNSFIEVWTTAEVSHGEEDYALANMAVNHTFSSAAAITVDTEGEFLVIMLQIDGPVELVSDSNTLANAGIEAIEEGTTLDPFAKDPTLLVIVVAIFLLLISLPATVMLIREIRNKPPTDESE
jgi:hypothetical protein